MKKNNIMTYNKAVITICIAILALIVILGLVRVSTSVNIDGLYTTDQIETEECHRHYISVTKYPCEWVGK